MATTRDLPIPNLFLAALPREEYDRLRPHLESVKLSSRQILFEAGRPIDYCYFTDGGMSSLLIPLEDGAMIEAGVVGKEGFAGLSAVLGAETSAHTGMTQLPGIGVRLKPALLRQAMLENPAVLDQVLRYSQAFNIQISQTVVCNARHALEERLARWLLMAHDRAEDDVLPLTHEFISMMLGVRRPGVTIAAHSLHQTGAIDYARGRITVLDRKRLEEISCECYVAVREQCKQLLGWPAE